MAGRSARSRRPTSSSTSSARRSSARTFENRASGLTDPLTALTPIQTFSRAVSSVKMLVNWKVREMPSLAICSGVRPVMSCPSNRMLPSEAGSAPGDHVEERRLAGAVRSDDGAHRTARHVEIDVRQRRQPAEPARQAAGLEDHGATFPALRFTSAASDCMAPASPLGRKMTEAMMMAPTSIG